MQSNRSGSVRVRHEEGVAWVEFDRPEARNAMTWEMYAQLEEICADCGRNAAVEVVVLRGVGGAAFVAGTDIAQFEAFEDGAAGVAYERRIDAVVGAVERIEQPTIAMLEGFCVGGGAAIALACDFRYADPALKFGVPIARTLGNCLSVTNVARLVEALGVARSKEVLMMARLLDVEEALACGVINERFESDEIDAALAARIERLRRHAPLTLRASKLAIQRVLDARRPGHEAGDDLIEACYGSEDFAAAVSAFVEKRPYQWRGR
ncbi:enoyl-CoA hydratase [Halotalea alkalilenta]|uniref:Enoyl-CoA hydratase n=1 Tax=Halotalea alkalilenta TaxID=376489 RepID=A0A172YJ23_9GAMM|nr:enoyl-CoA hydratase [Halotalea alkalilenta]ANF59199.1 enoyl-CoA hydratase [Halotalea alkalilenta]